MPNLTANKIYHWIYRASWNLFEIWIGLCTVVITHGLIYIAIVGRENSTDPVPHWFVFIIEMAIFLWLFSAYVNRVVDTKLREKK